MSRLSRFIASVGRHLGGTPKGAVEVLNNRQALGWAVGADGERLAIEAWLGETRLGAGLAEADRPDLAAAGLGDGRHGFAIAFARHLSDMELARVRIVAESGQELPQISGAIRPMGMIALGDLPAPPPGAPRPRSPFGGLWTDTDEALSQLDDKRRQGLVDADDHALLRGWIEDGYAILPGAVPADLCDRVIEDAERAARGEIALYREMASSDGGLIAAAGERRGKLIDLYVKSAAAREAITHPRIARFLNLIFARPALAFQSLYFEYGSEQRLHQDTAFVPVSAPLELAASWIALEDIAEGAGELVYVPGSQRIPDFLFDGAFRQMPAGSVEEEAFHSHIDAEVARLGLASRRFLARKGDVLIWSADLAHGGSPIRGGADRPTRRSLVAHYCPLDRRPAYLINPASVTRHRPDIATVYAPRPY